MTGRVPMLTTGVVSDRCAGICAAGYTPEGLVVIAGVAFPADEARKLLGFIELACDNAERITRNSQCQK